MLIVTLELDPNEVAMLHLILDSYLADLRTEIRETDSRSFRAMLKEREVLLKKLLHQLEGAPV